MVGCEEADVPLPHLMHLYFVVVIYYREREILYTEA